MDGCGCEDQRHGRWHDEMNHTFSNHFKATRSSRVSKNPRIKNKLKKLINNGSKNKNDKISSAVNYSS